MINLKFSINAKLMRILSLLIAGLLIYAGNNFIFTNTIKIFNKKIPQSFDNYKIVHVSDLHNKKFGHNQKILIDKIKEQSPDIIVITGDLIRGRSDDISNAVKFIEEALKIAPVYFVNGNHEVRSINYDKIRNILTKLGVITLEGKSLNLYSENEYITISGVNDPCYYRRLKKSSIDIMRYMLSKIKIDKNNYNILLSHVPHMIDLYSSFGYDLVFSGHAHGGQFRIPFLGGMYAPGQGFFPKYTSGEYKLSETTEIVSRGLGGSRIPIRIFNNPEIIVCKLKSKN